MHELMDKYLGLLTIVQFIEPFSVYFYDIGHRKSRDLMKYLAEAPNTRNSARLRVETTDTIYPVFINMSKFYLMDEHIDAFFDIWSEYVFHKNAMVAGTAPSNKE